MLETTFNPNTSDSCGHVPVTYQLLEHDTPQHIRGSTAAESSHPEAYALAKEGDAPSQRQFGQA